MLLRRENASEQLDPLLSSMATVAPARMPLSVLDYIVGRVVDIDTWSSKMPAEESWAPFVAEKKLPLGVVDRSC